MDFRYKELSWKDICLDWDDFVFSLGKGYKMEGEVLTMFSALEREVTQFCKPRWGYRVFSLDASDKSRIILNGCRLQPGRIITPYLENAELCALFVATAGEEFERFQQTVKKSGQIVEEFLLDALGSAIAEATVREACKAIEKEFGAKGLGISYPYSPGYCGWKVSDQQILFSLLPNQPCGVSLTASSLMCPIKSGSGVVGIGRQMTRQKYGCELCGKKDCYKNRLNK